MAQNSAKCCNPFGKCQKECEKGDSNHKPFCDTRSKVSLKDKGGKSNFIYDNEDNDLLNNVQIDGCIIGQETDKCDYLLLNCTKQWGCFVELKGADLLKAVEQVTTTNNLLKQQLKEFTLHARIVLTKNRVPDYRNTKEYKAFKKLFNNNIGNPKSLKLEAKAADFE